MRERERESCSSIALPVEETSVHHARPGQAGWLFADEILGDDFLGGKKGYCFDDAWLGGLGAIFWPEEPLYSHFDGCVDECLVLIDVERWRQINHDVLAFEGSDDFFFGVRVRDGMDFEVRRECRLGALAGEDGEIQGWFGMDGFD